MTSTGWSWPPPGPTRCVTWPGRRKRTPKPRPGMGGVPAQRGRAHRPHRRRPPASLEGLDVEGAPAGAFSDRPVAVGRPRPHRGAHHCAGRRQPGRAAHGWARPRGPGRRWPARLIATGASVTAAGAAWLQARRFALAMPTAIGAAGALTAVWLLSQSTGGLSTIVSGVLLGLFVGVMFARLPMVLGPVPAGR